MLLQLGKGVKHIFSKHISRLIEGGGGHCTIQSKVCMSCSNNNGQRTESLPLFCLSAFSFLSFCTPNILLSARWWFCQHWSRECQKPALHQCSQWLLQQSSGYLAYVWSASHWMLSGVQEYCWLEVAYISVLEYIWIDSWGAMIVRSLCACHLIPYLWQWSYDLYQANLSYSLTTSPTAQYSRQKQSLHHQQ